MLKTIVVAATVALAGTAYAQNNQGTGSSKSAPGQQMNNSTTSTGPGASEYSPGHKMQNAKKLGTRSTAPGASEYAPGHQGTTVGSTGTKAKTGTKSRN